MANFSFDVRCGQNTFVFVVDRPAGVLFSDMRVIYVAPATYRVTIDYISDNRQTDPGPDAFDSGVAHGGPFDFDYSVMVDGVVQVSDIKPQKTCP